MIKDYKRFDLFGKLLIEKVTLEPPFRIKAPMPNEACFFYGIQGKGRIYSATEEMILRSNEGVVLRCGNYLNDWLKTQDSEYCEAIAVHFYPEVLKKIYDHELPAFIQEANVKRATCISKVKADTLLHNYIDNLLFYFENPSLVSEDLLKLKVRELILLLAKTDNAQAIKELIASLFTPGEYSFKEIIEAHIYSNLTNEELAGLTNLSLSSFKREFEKVYHTSPAKYFKSRKLDRAAQLLKTTHQRIGDIAYDCGFKEVSHFSRSFQKHFGYSPSEYRLSQTGK